jgi:hypothetical protein
MAYTWDQMTFLTAGQRTAAQQLATLGASLPKDGGDAPLEGFTPPLSMSNTKRAKETYTNLQSLWADALKGIQYSLMYYRKQNAQTFEDANP